MAKSPQQKRKILYLMKAFLEQTDEKHPMTAKELGAYLEKFGISAERKTIYDDIDTLRLFGMDIGHRRERPAGFYLAKRDFDMADLKLLADMIQSSRYISEKKAEDLIGKLEKLVSVHEAKQLQRPIYLEKRARSMKDSVYTHVNEIQTAIYENKQISFQYYQWTAAKKIQLLKSGQRYHVSPWGLIWKDGNYYLIAIDESNRMVKHFRADKMLKIRKEKEERTGSEMFRGIDIGEFASRMFPLFGSRDESVTLEFENHFIGDVIDTFGEDVRIVQKDSEHFHVLLRVRADSRFYGWAAGMGPGVRIVSPEKAQQGYKKFLKNALENLT